MLSLDGVSRGLSYLKERHKHSVPSREEDVLDESDELEMLPDKGAMFEPVRSPYTMRTIAGVPWSPVDLLDAVPRTVWESMNTLETVRW